MDRCLDQIAAAKLLAHRRLSDQLPRQLHFVQAMAMASHSAPADLGIAPRLLKREQAAAYCGVDVSTFAAWVRRGIIPGPVSATHRWDRKAIDAALDALSRIEDRIEYNALDQWKAKHRASHAERNSSS